MTLYHFTQPANVIPIMWEGLTPNPDDDLPAVWLTEESALQQRPFDRTQMARLADARLTVEVTESRNGPLLVRFPEWRRTVIRPPRQRAPRSFIPLEQWRFFWLYFGRIPPEQITAIRYGRPRFQQFND